MSSAIRDLVSSWKTTLPRRGETDAILVEILDFILEILVPNLDFKDPLFFLLKEPEAFLEKCAGEE